MSGPKFRIVKRGDVFVVQRRSLLLWLDESAPVDAYTSFPLAFKTVEDARRHVDRQKVCCCAPDEVVEEIG